MTSLIGVLVFIADALLVCFFKSPIQLLENQRVEDGWAWARRTEPERPFEVDAAHGGYIHFHPVFLSYDAQSAVLHFYLSTLPRAYLRQCFKASAQSFRHRYSS